MDRTADGPLIDKQQTVALRRKPPLPELMDGGDRAPIPPRATFIGRRREIRRHLRPLVDATQPRLFITGPGGVGKTTLAGRFARELLERLPDARLLGFRAPFDLTTLFETLRRHVESEPSGVEMLAELGLQDERQRIAALLRWLATRADRPLCLVLDNLESLQALSTLAVEEDHADSLCLLRTVCALPLPTRVLLTGRYAVAELADCDIVNCPLPDAPYGDVLRRMNRLNWPDDWDAERKRSLYKTLGGNHRALEWLAELLQNRSAADSDSLLGKLGQLQSPPDTPEAAVETVLEDMRANLLLDELLDDLPAGWHCPRCATGFASVLLVSHYRLVKDGWGGYELSRVRVSSWPLLGRKQ